ncbi:response regulator [Fibrella aquatilis]|uniref:Response regulator n=1 Tax=Fibrella aquatilis TaxID=2817059 RepID=A0A939G904_9BACT|nr:response regulator [Fibrella aquatilis]MBO0932550.1 response regulator [Fibrella aquatilis]
MNITLIRKQEENSLPKYLMHDDYSTRVIELETELASDSHLDYDTRLDDMLNKNSTTLSQSDLIVISYIGDNSDMFLGLRLIYHLRLSKDYRSKPIVLTGDTNFDQLVSDTSDSGYKELTLILNTAGIIYQTENQLNCLLLHYLSKQLVLKIPVKNEDYLNQFLKKMVIREPDEQYGRHGIANEWGAYRMAEVAGLDLKDFKYPKTLYFKYLLGFKDEKNATPSKLKPFFDKNLTILYIDDNEYKGWTKCLELILNNKIISNGKATIISRKAWDIALEGDIENDKFDLVFLDYYLADHKKGDKILSDIKKLNPVLPVIMFTASNKAWNMDKLYEAGADGYYVKEHPETAKNWKFSVENFDEFHRTINHCLKKGKLLRPYLSKIKEIKSKIVINDPPGEIIKERIDERLHMFLGLLKKSFEQTDFDQITFFYSDTELAYLTLWSVLNEIQQAFFEKQAVVYVDRNGNSYVEHDRRTEIPKPSLPKRHNWTLKLPSSFRPRYLKFVEYNPVFNYDSSGSVRDGYGYYDINPNPSSILYYDGDNRHGRYYSFNPRGVVHVKKNLEQILHCQIAFILLNMSCRQQLLTSLKNLNDTRNKLYLTHGDDSSLTNYGALIRSQRVPDLDKKCKQLFDIVYFLTSGVECVW